MRAERRELARERRRALRGRPIEEQRPTVRDRHVLVAPRVERRYRRDGRAARDERRERGRSSRGDRRDVQARFERGGTSIGAAGSEALVELTARAQHCVVERSTVSSSLGRRGVAFGLGGREQHVDERSDRAVVRDQRPFVGGRAPVACDGALHTIVCRLRLPEQASHELVPRRAREIEAALAIDEVDEIALVAVETDAREEPRRRDTFPERTCHAQIDHRELELGIVAGAERKGAVHVSRAPGASWTSACGAEYARGATSESVPGPHRPTS